MEMGGAKLIPSTTICEKLFACKGNKIFHTALEYVFDATHATVVPHEYENANLMTGTVEEILDYGHIRYAIINAAGQKLTAAYDGQVGDAVDVIVPVDQITIKDKTIDIIIV